MVAPITHVSVTLDGIPEVVEVHQPQDCYSESLDTPELEQPKKKKGKGAHGIYNFGITKHLEMCCLHPVCIQVPFSINRSYACKHQ